MTGYAVATSEGAAGTLTIEIKSVNSRFLDLQFRINDDLRQAEPILREAITGKLSRGKVECRFNLQTKDSAPRELAMNAVLLGQLKNAQLAIQAELPQAAPLSVAEVLRWPGMLADDSPTFDALQPEIVRLVAAALDELVATRRREGEKLAEVILERVARMRELVREVAPRIPAAQQAFQDKLKQRLVDAIGSADDERIRQEVAVFATRIDVAEELSRLTTHLDEVERITEELVVLGLAGRQLRCAEGDVGGLGLEAELVPIQVIAFGGHKAQLD